MKKIIFNTDNYIGTIDETEIQLYPRKSSVSGKGFVSGYYVNDNIYLCESEENELEELISKAGYYGRGEAFEDEFYYYTDWFDEEFTIGDIVYDKDGNEYEIEVII